jgi:tetratricopeptide (TPR) repeat protein
MGDAEGRPGVGEAAALQNARRFDEAAEAWLAIARTELTPRVAANLGLCLIELAEPARAADFLALAARGAPANPAVRRALGVAWAAAGRVRLAEREFREALRLAPDDGVTQLSFAGLLLSLGRYAEGWPLLAPRAELNPDLVPAVKVGFPEWRGEPLAGKSVLVWLEQGFGDQIQMSRFASELKARGAAKVSLACRPQLARLFSTLAGVDEIIAAGVGERLAVARHDYWSRYFSLPEHLGVTLETLPAQPYLAAPDDRRARWRGDQALQPGVGLVWRASPTGFNATAKGLPDALAQRFLDRGAISLHPEDTGAADFADTAAIIETLDLVVSIDTSVAHLAGAMGKPCWTLLPAHRCDWRWLRERSDSPWYPTMRLYRQDQPHDWTPAVERALADLAAEGR